MSYHNKDGQYANVTRAKRFARGECIDCGQPREQARRSRCNACLAEARLKAGRRASTDEGTAAAASYRRRLKFEAISAYGGVCACCGESNPAFLTLDHPNGDGANHRRALWKEFHELPESEGKWGGYPFNLWLRRNGYPPGLLRVLCWNCNCASWQYGECPHKTAAREPIYAHA